MGVLIEQIVSYCLDHLFFSYGFRARTFPRIHAINFCSITFNAFVPAYCLLMMSPLFAHNTMNGVFNWSGTCINCVTHLVVSPNCSYFTKKSLTCEYGGIRPIFTNCDSRTARPIAVWTTFVRSRQSIQLTRKTAFWLQIAPFASRQWKLIFTTSGPSASINADTFSKCIPRLNAYANKYLKINFFFVYGKLWRNAVFDCLPILMEVKCHID